MLRRPSLDIPARVKQVTLAFVMLLVLFKLDPVHPRFDALAIALCTLVLLLGRDGWLPQWRVVRGIERIGDCSYSVYLVHWPLFAFAFSAYLGEPPVAVRVVLVGVALLLGAAQFRLVEQPFRYGWREAANRTWRWFVAATALVVLVPAPALLRADAEFRAEDARIRQMRQINYGLSPRCKDVGSPEWKQACRTATEPGLAVWGDSYAMHLVPGVAESLGTVTGVAQYTKSACGPIVDYAVIIREYDRAWADGCRAFNEKAFRAILDDPLIRVVVLGMSMRKYVRHGRGRMVVGNTVSPNDPEMFLTQFEKTISHLRAAGKDVLLFAPPPIAGFNIAECLERRRRGLVILGRDACEIHRAEFESYQVLVLEALDVLAARTGVRIAHLSDILCNLRECQVERNGLFLYRDGGHLSIEGSRQLIPELARLALSANAD